MLCKAIGRQYDYDYEKKEVLRFDTILYEGTDEELAKRIARHDLEHGPYECVKVKGFGGVTLLRMMRKHPKPDPKQHPGRYQLIRLEHSYSEKIKSKTRPN